MDRVGSESKNVRRAEILAARGALTAADRERAGDAIAHHVLGLPALAGARSVAAYLALPDEPPTGPLVAGLLRRGVAVWVPVVETGATLRWARVVDGGTTRVGRFGIVEPETPTSGPEVLAGLDAVIAPALSVDHRGRRLGRGGGYYDRALEGHDGLVVALLHDGEIVPEVPHEEHDVTVDLVVCPSGVFRPERD